MPDIQKTQDALIEMAKDLLMLNMVPLLEGLDAAKGQGGGIPVRFASADKTDAFYKMVVAFHAAHGASEEFRRAHVADLNRERAEWAASTQGEFGPDRFKREVMGEYPGGLSPEDIEHRPAS